MDLCDTHYYLEEIKLHVHTSITGVYLFFFYILSLSWKNECQQWNTIMPKAQRRIFLLSLPRDAYIDLIGGSKIYLTGGMV